MVISKLSLGVVLFTALFLAAQEQPIQPSERETARAMLSDAKDDLKHSYYDPKFHGADMDGRYKEAADRINRATSFNQALGVVAWFLEGLHDAHTTFLPPPRPFVIEQGWRMQMIGDRCLVVAVKPGSDAEKQGLSPGDQALQINGLVPSRSDLRKIQYLFGVLRPQPGLELLIRDSEQKERKIGVAFHIRETRRILDFSRGDFWDEIRESQKQQSLYQRRSREVGDTIVWKLPSFAVDEKSADVMIAESMKYKSLVLDLRGNPGGSVETLVHLVRHLFDHDIEVAEVQKRDKSEKLIAKSRSPVFSGKVVVLMDGASASASEVFARVMQLEKRATVVGDRSSGSVMEAQIHPHHTDFTRRIYYANEVTHASLIMADGQSLENQGITPDIELIPTPEDLSRNRDPVLARALSLVGQSITSEDAGKLFPIQWGED